MDSHNITVRYFRNDEGLNIAYRGKGETNNGRRVILLHGLGGDGEAWMWVQNELWNQGIASVAIDLRGQGLSDRPDNLQDYQLEKNVKDLVSFLENKHWENNILVGHCYGGMVAQRLAIEYPGLFKGLILINSNDQATILGLPKIVVNYLAQTLEIFSRFTKKAKPEARESYTKYMDTPDIYIPRLLSDVRTTTKRAFLLLCAQTLKFDNRAEVNKIKIPTLLISGEKDVMFRPKTVKEMAKRITGAKFVEIPNTNHIVVINKPRELAKEIANFVSV